MFAIYKSKHLSERWGPINHVQAFERGLSAAQVNELAAPIVAGAKCMLLTMRLTEWWWAGFNAPRVGASHFERAAVSGKAAIHSHIGTNVSHTRSI